MDKQIIECKYKFQSIEKFNGKPYCTLLHELCEDINFVCDKNCQVYEDYKQLKRAEQKLEKIAKVCDKFIPDHYKILLIINGGIIEE